MATCLKTLGLWNIQWNVMLNWLLWYYRMPVWIVRNVKVSRLKFLVRTCSLCLLWQIKIDTLNASTALKWWIVLERLSIIFQGFSQHKNAKSHRKKHSAVLNTPEMGVGENNWTVFSFTGSEPGLKHTLSVTGWCAHTPLDPELSQEKCAGWTMRFLQHRVETSPPAQWLGHTYPARIPLG